MKLRKYGDGFGWVELSFGSWTVQKIVQIWRRILNENLIKISKHPPNKSPPHPNLVSDIQKQILITTAIKCFNFLLSCLPWKLCHFIRKKTIYSYCILSLNRNDCYNQTVWRLLDWIHVNNSVLLSVIFFFIGDGLDCLILILNFVAGKWSMNSFEVFLKQFWSFSVAFLKISRVSFILGIILLDSAFYHLDPFSFSLVWKLP